MKCLVRLACVLLTGSTMAGALLTVQPNSIDRFETGSVTIVMSPGVGPEIRLSLLVDANGNAVEDPEDYVVWSDIVPADVAEWSPVMAADTDPTTNAEIAVRLFTPSAFPYTVGHYLWRAEDDSTSVEAPFEVTQQPAAQAVSGIVMDETMTPVPGALVFVFPLSEDCEQNEYAALTDENGSYTIEFPDGPACAHQVVEAVRPGSITAFGEQVIEFTGSDRFSGVDVQLTAGDHTVDGNVVYSSGARMGEGIPGLLVFADSADDRGAVAFTGLDGSFVFTLTDGDWEVGVEDEIQLSLQGAVRPQVEGMQVTVSGGPATVPDLDAPAANAVVRGTLFDDVLASQAGERVEANDEFPCEGICHDTAAITGADGGFVLAVLAPPMPDFATLRIGPARPLIGLVGRQSQVDISEGDDFSNQDVEHVTPTSVVFGRFTDTAGNPVGDLCLRGFGFDGGGESFVSRAQVDCDGTYSLPVIDGAWQIRKNEDDLLGPARGLDPSPIDEQVVIAGEDEEANYIIGRWVGAPTLFSRDPASASAGDHVVLQGFAFSGDGAPTVTIDGVPAGILFARNDLGRLAVEVPAGLTPGVATIVLTNPDLGMASNEVCVEVTAGTFTPTCTIDGTVTRNAGSVLVENSVIAVIDEQDEIRRVAVTDAAGVWSADLEDAAGSYTLIVIPPAGLDRVWGFYPSVACPAVQDHNFTFGRQVAGRVVDTFGDGLPNVQVEVDGMEAFANVLTGPSGFFLTRMAPDDTVDVSFTAPHGSRFINDQSIDGILVDTAINLPPVQLNSGEIFGGHVIDKNERGVEAFVAAIERSGPGTGFDGETVSNSCSGRFNLAVESNEYELIVAAGDGDAETRVQWVVADGDEVAEFDFRVFDDSALQHDGPEPRVSELETGGQIGQAVRITVENLAVTDVEVFFSTAATGATAGVTAVPGDGTIWDPGRGQVLTRVPATAASGDLFVQVQGVDSAPFPLTVDATLFDLGANTISGTVTASGSPVENALVLLFRFDPNASDCDDDDDVVHDYALTDASGGYAVMHPGGDLQLLVLPPTASTLQGFQAGLPAETGDRPGFDIALVDGMELSLRLVTGSPPVPVPNALVFVEQVDLPDLRMTDANGDVTFRFPAGPVDVEALPPVGSRLLELEQQFTVPGSPGDVALTAGVFVGGRVTDETGQPVVGASAEANGADPPFGFFFETAVSADGAWNGPVTSGARFNLRLLSERDDLADLQFFDDDGQDRDVIRYPTDEFGPAGLIEGTVFDADSGAPLAFTNVNAQRDEGGLPGSFSGFAETCDDGTFSMKLAAGPHFVAVFPPYGGDYLEAWYSPGTPADSCQDDAESVTVPIGGTVGSVDIDLAFRSSVSGAAYQFGTPVPGASITITEGNLGSCVAFGFTDGSGGYFADRVPAGAGYRVEATPPPQIPAPPQCYDGEVNCTTFTPVTADPLTGVAGIDFEFGSAPPEVSEFLQLTVNPDGGGQLVLRFENLPPEAFVDVYNVYTGTIGVFDTADITDCWIDPATLADNGDGTLSYTLIPGGGTEWYLVSAGNTLGESSLGNDRTLTNGCGIAP